MEVKDSMIRQTENGVLIEVKVRPKSKRFALVKKGDHLILEVTSPAREGKANLEIVKGLKKLLGRDVEIVKGFKTRDKVILIKNFRKEDLEFG